MKLFEKPTNNFKTGFCLYMLSQVLLKTHSTKDCLYCLRRGKKGLFIKKQNKTKLFSSGTEGKQDGGAHGAVLLVGGGATFSGPGQPGGADLCQIYWWPTQDAQDHQPLAEPFSNSACPLAQSCRDHLGTTQDHHPPSKREVQRRLWSVSLTTGRRGRHLGLHISAGGEAALGADTHFWVDTKN